MTTNTELYVKASASTADWVTLTWKQSGQDDALSVPSLVSHNALAARVAQLEQQMAVLSSALGALTTEMGSISAAAAAAQTTADNSQDYAESVWGLTTLALQRLTAAGL